MGLIFSGLMSKLSYKIVLCANKQRNSIKPKLLGFQSSYKVVNSKVPIHLISDSVEKNTFFFHNKYKFQIANKLTLNFMRLVSITGWLSPNSSQISKMTWIELFLKFDNSEFPSSISEKLAHEAEWRTDQNQEFWARPPVEFERWT